MIIEKNMLDTEVRENMRGGAGSVEVTKFVSPAQLLQKGRLFACLSIKPGCGIGYHIHDCDTEIFYIMSGSAVYNDNGTVKTLKKGDVAVTPQGTSHSIQNDSQELLEVIALIINAD